ncbi:MAG: hypothetical protein E6357_26230 [Clostridiales bacterium]|nr:hypothetical protein [Clostridiales bacterium]
MKCKGGKNALKHYYESDIKILEASMRNNGLRLDDPVYYKRKLKELIEGAQVNGLKIQGVVALGNIQILFKSSNGECAGAVIPTENRI